MPLPLTKLELTLILPFLSLTHQLIFTKITFNELSKSPGNKQITNFEEARPGDFIDFSRENQTGHTVVLIDWVRDNGKIVGLRYWSSQESTNGIDYKTEYFNILRSDGTKYGSIMKDQVYIGRVIP